MSGTHNFNRIFALKWEVTCNSCAIGIPIWIKIKINWIKIWNNGSLCSNENESVPHPALYQSALTIKFQSFGFLKTSHKFAFCSGLHYKCWRFWKWARLLLNSSWILVLIPLVMVMSFGTLSKHLAHLALSNHINIIRSPQNHLK